MSDTFDLKNDDDDSFDTNAAVDEEISNIFLPISSDIKDPQLKIILIEGAPGIGKTMLIMEIARLWANEKILNKKKMLLFFSLSDPAIKDMKSTEDMFFYSFKNESNAKNCADYFGKVSGQGLVILLDGLDENPQAMQNGSFFYDLIIMQKIFIEAYFVITSRPHATTKLQQYVNCRVEIIGFTDKRRCEFVQENLEKNAENLKSYLQKHEIIDTLCYIPLNMCIVVSLFNTEIELENLPSTQTELTMQAVSITVFHNLEKLGIIKKESKIDLKHLPKPYDEIFYYLSALAYKALTENKLTFTIEEIRKACPVSTNSDDDKVERAITDGLGLMQTTRFFTDIGANTESSSNFAHYSVQELLAAWYIAFSHHSHFQKLPLTCNIQKGIQNCMQTLFQLKVLSTNFWEGKFINMWSFYIGLTGGKDFAFKWILSNRSMQCKKRYFLQKTTSSEAVENVEYNLSKKVLKNKIKTLLLYFLLQEAPDNEMIEQLDTVVTQEMLDVSEQTLQSNEEDLHLLGYILSRPYLTKQWELVDISHCEIDDKMFKILHGVITRNDGRPKPEIKALSLSGNRLTSCSDAIVHLVCCQKIQHLNLSNNNLQSMVPFKRCGDFLETLHISNNKLDNEKALELFNALKFLRKLKVLQLDHNEIKGDQHVINAIGLALCYCNSLKKLKLDGNTTEFEDKAMILFEVINEIRESKSNVHYYRLTDKSSAFLKILGYCDEIDYQADSCVLKKKMVQSKVVNVSCNGLKTDDGCFLGQNLYLLAELKILNITKNKISDEGTKALTVGLLLTFNLEEFKYDGNLFSEDSNMIFKMIQQLRNNSSKKSFECAPSKVKALVFVLNCINDNKEEVQSSDIVSAIGFITELNLSHNEPTALKLANEELKDLCALLKWFKQLKVLDVRNNDITDEAKESMAKAMLQIHTLNSFKLIGNPISDDEVSMAIFDTIKNVREKQLKSIICNQNRSSCIEFQAIIKIMECLSQLENPNCFKSFDNITTVTIDSESAYGAKFLEYLKFLPFLINLKINNVTCITKCGINQLSKYLSQNRTLTTLDLSFCNLENLEVENGPGGSIPLKLMKFNYSNITDAVLLKLSLNMLKFTNLDQLEMKGNCFGDKGISNLHNVLFNCENDRVSTTMTTLDIADNQLTKSSALKIIKIVEICKVKYLDVSNNYLGSIFSYFKHSAITTLEELNISSNSLKASDAVCLGQHLHLLVNLKILNITKNDITDDATKSLTTGMLLTPNLEKFRYDENLFSEDSSMIFRMIHQLRTTSNTALFKCAPLQIKALVFILNCVNDNEEKMQSSDIVSTIGLITELNLSHNEPATLEYKLTSEDLKKLCAVLRWFRQLKVLDVRNNDITNEAKESVTSMMLQIGILNNYNLKLIGNPIFDDEISMAILDTIKNLHEEQVQSIISDQKSSSHIECQCIIYIMACLSRLENSNCFKSLDNIITVDIVSEPGYGVKFLEYLNFLPFLKDLKINNVKSISECGINQLSNYLSQNRTLTTLDLSFCNLCNLAFENGPSNIFPLQILKINYSDITDEVLFKLSFHMLKFTHLKQLELEGNCFGDKGISNLHNVLLTCENTSATITELNLANNQLTSSSTAEIIEIVKICKVKILNISNNNLQSIFSYFEKYTITTLEELNVSANNHQKCNAVHFAESISYLKSCRRLKKLDISNNNIDDTAIDAICCSFMECSHLKDVPCNENQAEKKIESAFHFVQSLNSQHNCIKFKELPALAPTLISVISCSLSDQSGGFSKVGQVTEIDFSCNNLKIDKNLVCVLQNCTQLTVLNLEHNNITNETFKYLATGFLFTSKLKYPNLHLKGNPCKDNPKNELVLQMIATLRSDVNDFECPPQDFEPFIVVLELVDSVSGSPNDVSKTISLIKTLNLSLKTLNLRRKSLNLSHSELSSSFNKQAKDTNQVLLQSCDVKLLCHYFKYFKSLKSINMMNNSIKEDIKDDLAIAVLQHHCLSEIQLEGNPICKQKKCFRLFDTIEKLRRFGNPYTFKDRPEMLEALVNILKYINNFDDKFCDITDSCECLDVSSFYEQKAKNRLYGIEKIDNPEEICTSLVYHLKLFHRLKILNLSNAHLTALDALQELSKFLCNNNTLLQLNLSNNRIQVEGALIVLKSLDTNTTLTKLNLNNNKLSGNNNKLSEKKCKEIAITIRRLPKNINVDILRGNELTTESKEMIKMIQ